MQLFPRPCRHGSWIQDSAGPALLLELSGCEDRFLCGVPLRQEEAESILNCVHKRFVVDGRTRLPSSRPLRGPSGLPVP